MGEIEPLPPANRIPPARPPVGSGEHEPQRQPATGDRHPDQQRRRKPDDDHAPRVDDYA